MASRVDPENIRAVATFSATSSGATVASALENALPTGEGNLVVNVSSGDILDVRHFEVSERISTLFSVSLRVVSDNPDIDFEAVVGQPARFVIHRGIAGLPQTRVFTGICNQLQQVGVEPGGLSTYQLEIVPTLWLATQRRNYRMFQQLSELDIVMKLLEEWNIEPVTRITGSYKKRKYRVQYGESDYTFLCRMLEDAGISFYFAEFDDETRLVLSDAPQANERREPPIAFNDRPTVADREHVTALRMGRKVRPGRYTLRDHDYRRPPSYKLLASASGGASVESRLERYHYTPGAFLFESDRGEATPVADDRGKHRTDETEAATLAQKRLDAKRASATVVSFETNAVDLRPGMVMSILDYPRSDLGDDKRLLVVASTLSGEPNDEWIHRCEALSAEAPYRPSLATPKPKVNGVESATVVGPPGEEIHTDEFGRVRVHFHWDRESQMDDTSSCWIHVSHAWGGAGYGGVNLPRVGQEVLVDFLGGDPDRPIIVGRVYTNLQKVPYGLPANKTQSGWKSNSTGGGGGYNEIMFEDSAGRELVRVQAEKDMTKLVKHDESNTVGHDRSRLVKHDESITVDNDRTKLVKNNESTTIGNDRTTHIQHDESLTVDNDRTKHVLHDETVTVDNDRTEHVGHDEDITVDNDRTELVQANEDLTIGKNRSKLVGENEREVTGLNRTIVVGVNRSAQVGVVDSTTVGVMHKVMIAPPDADGGGDLTSTMMIDKKIVLTTGAGATITLEGAAITLDADTIFLKANKNIRLDAAEEYVGIHAKTNIGIVSDQTVTASADGGAFFVGAAGGDVIISASAGQNVSISAMSNVTVAASAQATLTGGSGTTVSSGGDVLLQGGPWVKINP